MITAEQAQHLENLRVAAQTKAPELYLRLVRRGTANGLPHLAVGLNPVRLVTIAAPQEPACQEPYYRWAKSGIALGPVFDPEGAADKVIAVACRARVD